MLSYWEKEYFIGNPDILIVGAGIIGCYTALNLRERFPSKSILVIDNGVLPDGASTKNAGFSCFGSPGELIDDLKSSSKESVVKTIQKRFQGIEEMKRWVKPQDIGFLQGGSMEVFLKGQEDEFHEVEHNLAYINELYLAATDQSSVCSINSNNHYGFGKFVGGVEIRIEGKLNTGLYIKTLHNILRNNGIDILLNCGLIEYFDELTSVRVRTSLGSIKTSKLCLCTNAFAGKLLNDLDVKPARAQVLVTEDLGFDYVHTFHNNKGYNYFRTIDGRILLGGARDKAMDEEETYELETSSIIMDELKNFLTEVVCPNKNPRVEYSWAGLMGVGISKEPLIGKTSDNVVYGVRMGGMGVAIGATVGRDIASLILE